LFAGGIGITPILSMAYRLKAQNIPFELHYFVRSHEMIAFYGNLTQLFAEQIHFHIQNQVDTECDMAKVLQQPDASKHLYVCGPTGFMQFVMQSAETAGWQPEQLHQEHFVAQQSKQENDEAFTVEIAGTGQRIEIHPEQTVTHALLAHGFDVPVSCEQGICGTCITRVVSGIPDHRDVFMTDEERALNNQFTPCCSRAKSKHLVIEL
jgi:vanillate O-demethylase ferredoxin subunit